MPRMFLYLALFAIVTIVATAALGLGLRSGDIRDPADQATRAALRVHFMAGLVCGIIVLLVNSVAFTYFMGTSRWCKEVSETYRLDTDFVRRSAMLKRKTLPVSVLSMLTIVGVAALGAAADPMAALQSQAPGGLSWGSLHLASAMLGLVVIGYGFFLQWGFIAENHEIIQRVLAEVKRIRTERGLD